MPCATCQCPGSLHTIPHGDRLVPLNCSYQASSRFRKGTLTSVSLYSKARPPFTGSPPAWAPAVCRLLSSAHPKRSVFVLSSVPKRIVSLSKKHKELASPSLWRALSFLVSFVLVFDSFSSR